MVDDVEPAQKGVEEGPQDAVVHAPFGSWPGEMTSLYERDKEHYDVFLKQQKSQEGMDEYMKEWVDSIPSHDALLEKIGKENLEKLKI